MFPNGQEGPVLSFGQDISSVRSRWPHRGPAARRSYLTVDDVLRFEMIRRAGDSSQEAVRITGTDDNAVLASCLALSGGSKGTCVDSDGLSADVQVQCGNTEKNVISEVSIRGRRGGRAADCTGLEIVLGVFCYTANLAITSTHVAKSARRPACRYCRRNRRKWGLIDVYGVTKGVKPNAPVIGPEAVG